MYGSLLWFKFGQHAYGPIDTDKMENLTFVPGRHKLEKGQVLNPDPSAYKLLHSLESPWPCLSFDILRDHLGSGKARKQYPATVYAVAGTQAARHHEKENEIMVMKLSKLSRMDRPDESSDDEDEDGDEQTDAVLETRGIRIGDCTNRIRAYQTQQSDADKLPLALTAAMTESGRVLIHDISTHLASFDTPGTAISASLNKPLHTITSHSRNEGYALDWSPQHSSHPHPRLLTADTAGSIYSHTIDNTGKLTSDTHPFTGHDSSVEELQWSPSESNVFASASADGTIRVWDLRSKARKPALNVRVSSTDVNVLSWSKQTEYLIASGAEDGMWAVWDLRQWKPSGSSQQAGAKSGEIQSTPVASFNWHKEQITSVEWHPTDDSVVCVAAGDNTVTQWDVAVEHDDEESKYSADAKDVPPQLLFSHYQEGVKESHWHPQQPGVVMATGATGFGVFRTISV